MSSLFPKLVRRFSLLFVLIWIVTALDSHPVSAAAVRPLTLGFEGDARQLPNQMFGASVEALIEHLLDDPTKVTALKQVAPGVIRFPGGSQSNYYDWRTGLINVSAQQNSSSYMTFWATVAPRIDRAFPTGITMELYAPVAQQIGAKVILVPNLETSTVTDQVAWFKQLATESILPTDIELGNEFWIAMDLDPAVLKKWPDETTSMGIMQQYATALRPIVGRSGKFAVQASAAEFDNLPSAKGPLAQREFAWDSALAPAPWFDAVTLHLYPRPEVLAASVPNATTVQLFDLFMGHGDSAVDRVITDTAKRMPGKEIWITEWSPRGGNAADLTNPNFHELVPPPMRAQLVTRYELAFLRNPAVTKALYFTFNFDDKSVLQEFVRNPDGTGYVPMDPALVMSWFASAANAGGTFQRLIDPTAQPITGVGQFQDSYRAIEGGLFVQGKRTVLILQNASNEARTYDPSQGGTKPWPTQADLLVTSDLTAQAKVAGQTTSLPVSQPLTLPPYSILRLIWQ